MIDKQTQDNKGEKFVWEKFEEYLPKNYVVYNNRTVNSGEFDFCILAENQGVFIIEVKGWTAESVFDVAGHNEIIVSGYDKPQQSPLEQAKRYRYKVLNMLRDELGMNPLVMHLACYPFINREEFLNKNLNFASDEENTLLKEDFISKENLINKLTGVWQQEKGKIHDQLDSKKIALIRHRFEPSFEIKETDPILSPGYSKLRIISSNHDVPIVKIIDEYFLGIKEIVFLQDKKILNNLIDELFIKCKTKNIKLVGNNVEFGEQEQKHNEINEFHAFNIDLYYVESLNIKNDIEVEEGKLDQNIKSVLETLSTTTSFNLNQYLVEHAPTNKNILIKAGAGSGKTFSMVSRIAFLCNKALDSVSNISNDIAMITFTNDAANNMKKRIRQMFMNYFLLTKNKKYLKYIDDLQKMQISTIHKYVLEILRSNCLRVGLGHEFEITNETFNHDKIFALNLEKYLKQKIDENHDFIYQLPARNFELKEMLIKLSNQLYSKSIDVKNLTSSNLGNPPDTIPYFNELFEKVIIPSELEYDEQLKGINAMSLKRCMIVLNNLIKSGEIQNNIKIKYLFVDEFQDTDDTQIELIKGLQSICNNCLLFVVGDLKQSIYRFRGATLSAFDQIESEKERWSEHTLTKNYRSDKRLLEKFDKVFSYLSGKGYLPYNGEDVLYSDLITKIDVEDVIRKIEVDSTDKNKFFDVLYDEIKYQENIINGLEKIKKLSKEEKTIAILVRENKQVREVVSAMKKKGINVDVVTGGDLYQLQSTIDLFILTQALSNGENPVYLAELIASNYINAKGEFYKLKGLNKKEQLINALDEHFMNVINKTWRQICLEFQTKPVLSALRDIYEACQPWKNYSVDKDQQRNYRENYECLLEVITSRYKNEYLTLQIVNSHLMINITTRQSEQSRSETEDKNKIEVVCLTIHKSKGLEYGSVILPYTTDDITQLKDAGVYANMLKGKIIYRLMINKIPCENSEFDVEEESYEQAKEESRILYVAMTRAIRSFSWLHNKSNNTQNNYNSILEVLE